MRQVGNFCHLTTDNEYVANNDELIAKLKTAYPSVLVYDWDGGLMAKIQKKDGQS